MSELDLSWWERKDREQLKAAIAERAPEWAKQKIGLLDTIGPRLRDGWEPRVCRKESHVELHERR